LEPLSVQVAPVTDSSLEELKSLRIECIEPRRAQ
jgi:hypothetical protein